MSSFPSQYQTPPAPTIPGSKKFSNVQTNKTLKMDEKSIMPLWTTSSDVTLPTQGQIIYSTSTGKLQMFNGVTWETVTSS